MSAKFKAQIYRLGALSVLWAETNLNLIIIKRSITLCSSDISFQPRINFFCSVIGDFNAFCGFIVYKASICTKLRININKYD